MSLYVLDTDILTLFRHGHARIDERIEADPSLNLAVTVISVEEQLSGWYSMLRKVTEPPDLARAYQELADSTGISALGRFSPSPSRPSPAMTTL